MKFTFNKKEYELIVMNVAGSRLYGNATSESDWDYRGVFIAANSDKLGLIDHVEQLGGETGKGKSGELLYNSLSEAGLKLEETDDVVLYEIKRFIELARDANPNILDTLCHDQYSNANVYCNDQGHFLLSHKQLFMTKKLKHTFSGYAMSQLHKIKNHNRWIEKYPMSTLVLQMLVTHRNNRRIDRTWVSDNFGGRVASELFDDHIFPALAIDKKLPTNMSVDTFFKCHDVEYPQFAFPKVDIVELKRYMIPRMIDYVKAFDQKAKRLDLDAPFEMSTENDIEVLTIRDLLLESGSFRALGGSILNIFTDGSGIFDRQGSVKKHPPEEVGDFVCSIIIDKDRYKADFDEVSKMWKWKIERNIARSVLEDKHGYDTKHASHLYRLMIGAEHTLRDGLFDPVLTDDDLQMVKDVRSGKYEYDEIISYAKKSEELLNVLYESSTLPQKVDIHKINKLLLELQGVQSIKNTNV